MVGNGFFRLSTIFNCQICNLFSKEMYLVNALLVEE